MIEEDDMFVASVGAGEGELNIVRISMISSSIFSSLSLLKPSQK